MPTEQIYKDSLMTPSEKADHTLQIPMFIIGIGVSEQNIQYDTIPSEWLYNQLAHPTRIAIGREQGYPHLTRIGFEANKNKLKQRYLIHNKNYISWDAFETKIYQHFDKVEKNTIKHRKALQKKLDEIDQLLPLIQKSNKKDDEND